ncbi:MAG: Ig domain-containing protein [Actinomycetota bacterium]
MTLRRVLVIPLLALVLAAAAALVSNATAGIGDVACPNASGENTNTCPPGQVGVAYSIKFDLPPGSGCSPGDDKWTIISGTSPPGLRLSSDGTLSGTPTQAGLYKFWVEMRLPDNDQCNGTKDTTEREFTLEIRPGVPIPPRLIIGPESVSPGTVGTAYSAAMTANVADPKSWSIVAGALPPGLSLGTSNGVIAGTPTLAGSYVFTVKAAIADGRSDTKALAIDVRERLTISGSGDLQTRLVRTEVGVAFDASLSATGGFGTYQWSVEGDLPPGLSFDEDGVSGRPLQAGSFRFTVIVSDSEGRHAIYAARVIIAGRLSIVGTRLRPGTVGRFFRRKIALAGGIGPTSARVKRGSLPRGILFKRATGMFVGKPTRAGTWKIVIEVVDALGVKTRRSLVLIVRA